MRITRTAPASRSSPLPWYPGMFSVTITTINAPSGAPHAEPRPPMIGMKIARKTILRVKVSGVTACTDTVNSDPLVHAQERVASLFKLPADSEDDG